MQRANKFIAQEFQAYFWTLKIKQINNTKNGKIILQPQCQCIALNTHQRHNYFAIQQCCYFRFMNLDILSPTMLLYKLYFRHGYCYKREKWIQSHCELISDLFLHWIKFLDLKWVYFYVNNKSQQCFSKTFRWKFFYVEKKLWRMLIWSRRENHFIWCTLFKTLRFITTFTD